MMAKAHIAFAKINHDHGVQLGGGGGGGVTILVHFASVYKYYDHKVQEIQSLKISRVILPCHLLKVKHQVNDLQFIGHKKTGHRHTCT